MIVYYCVGLFVAGWMDCHDKDFKHGAAYRIMAVFCHAVLWPFFILTIAKRWRI